jgi:hypothetical protein
MKRKHSVVRRNQVFGCISPSKRLHEEQTAMQNAHWIVEEFENPLESEDQYEAF